MEYSSHVMNSFALCRFSHFSPRPRPPVFSRLLVLVPRRQRTQRPLPLLSSPVSSLSSFLFRTIAFQMADSYAGTPNGGDYGSMNGSANGSTSALPTRGLPPVIRKKLMGYVGFANLPNQVHRKSVRKGFQFTAMVVGQSCRVTVLLFRVSVTYHLNISDLFPFSQVNLGLESPLLSIPCLIPPFTLPRKCLHLAQRGRRRLPSRVSVPVRASFPFGHCLQQFINII
jgi:hypothetical protein